MGANISVIIPKKEIKLADLRGKKIAIDTYLELYQFLRTMPVFTDQKGRVTTHLAGLFFRTTHFMSLGIKPCFVLDGPPLEIGRHKKLVSNGAGIPCRIVCPRETETINTEIIQSTVRLLELLGLPVVQAQSEGEAQAAHMARRGDVWAVGSQDFDSLLFGAPRMIYNLTLAERRRVVSNFIHIKPHLIELPQVLDKLGISHNQLIILAILAGTDFNPNVPGIGPKSALKAVRRYKNFDNLFKKVGWSYIYSWKEIFDHIKTMPVTNNYTLKWKRIDKMAVKRFLCKEYDFDVKRVTRALMKI